MSLSQLKTAIPQPLRREFRRQLEFITDGRRHRGLALLRMPLVGELIAATIFERIFRHCNLELSHRLQREIEDSTHGRSAYAPGGYDTVRDSADMARRWRREMTSAEIDQVRRGYFACRPLFYDQPADW